MEISGINFSDELGRAVFMVGLPYPNKNSAELCERMKVGVLWLEICVNDLFKYVEEKIGAGAGGRYYKSLCMQSVNQAIGRVIRHRNDHAAIILMDTRYANADINGALPEWIRDRLTHCSKFPESIQKILAFFRNYR